MRILGVELGSWSLKAVEMESRFRRVDILDFHEIRLPLQILDPSAIYRDALTQLLARLPSHPEKIVVSLPAAQTALRFLPLPVKQRKKVEQMFRFELEDNVPFKLEDAIVEHHVSRTRDGSLVFAAIAPKRHISSYLDWLQSVGIDADWLTFEGMGVINLYLSSIDPKTPEKTPTGPVLMLDIGHTKTNLSLFEQERLELFRSIAWGGAAVTQSIAMSMGLSLEEAERYKTNELNLEENLETASEETRELVKSAAHAFTPFISDITHSLVAFRNLYKQEISSIVITGGTSKMSGIAPFLERTLRTPVSQFRAFQGLSLKADQSEADEARFGEPLGRAMVYARSATLLFNFRQQDMAKGTSLTEVSAILKDPNVLRLLTFSGVLAAILFVHVTIAGYLADSEARAASDELVKVFSKTFPNVPSKQKTALTRNPAQLKKFIEQKNNELDQKLKMMSKTRVPMMGLLKSVSNAFPPAVKVDVNTLQLDDRTFVMEGVLYAGDLNLVTESLKKIASLSHITLNRDGQRFTFKGEVVGR